MAEQEGGTQPKNGDQAMPILRLQKMYLKDLSFENPNAPEVFIGNQGEPKVEVNLNMKSRQLDGDSLYEVILNITASITQGEEKKTLFLIEVEHGGVFLLKNIPAEHMAMVLAVDCPTLLFPFTRQIISQVSVDGGFIPFLMEPVNFMALYHNSRQQQTSEKPQ